MKQNHIRSAILIGTVFFVLLGACAVSLFAQQPKLNTAVEEQAQPAAQDQEQQRIEEAKEKIGEATREAEAAKKKAEKHTKEAADKLREADEAKKEAEQIKGGTIGNKEAQDALKRAKEKELEAKDALAKAKEAQETARRAEAELVAAQEQVAEFEKKINAKQAAVYKRLIQTAIGIFIGYLILFVLVRVTNQRVEDIKSRHYIRKNIGYIVNFLLIVYVIFIWAQKIGSITLFFSVLGAGLVIVMQEPILCIAGWFLILVRRPFEVGDRVELAGVKGDVIDIRLFQTSLLEVGNWVDGDQSTGRVVNVPNNSVFKAENFNYSRGFEFIWNEIKVLVTFESNWKHAEEIMAAHGAKTAEGTDKVVAREIREMARRYMIYYEKLTPIVYVNIKDSGVELTLRYLTEARRRRSTQDKLCRAILDEFTKASDINFAYTTLRVVQ